MPDESARCLPADAADACTGPGCMRSCSYPDALNLARVPGAVRASRNGGGDQIRRGLVGPQPAPRRRHPMRFPFIPPAVDYELLVV